MVTSKMWGDSVMVVVMAKAAGKEASTLYGGVTTDLKAAREAIALMKEIIGACACLFNPPDVRAAVQRAPIRLRSGSLRAVASLAP